MYHEMGASDGYGGDSDDYGGAERVERVRTVMTMVVHRGWREWGQ